MYGGYVYAIGAPGPITTDLLLDMHACIAWRWRGCRSSGKERKAKTMTTKVTSLLLRSSGRIRPQVSASRYGQRGATTALCSHNFASSNLVTTTSSVPVSVPSTNYIDLRIHGFHSSSLNMNVQRRRRRGGGSPAAAAPVDGGGHGDEPHTARPVPVKDKAKFLAASSKELDRIEVAIDPMKLYNDVFDVTRSTNDEGEKLSIRLKGGDGTYTIQVDERNFTMNLTSPMSGVYTYVLCSKSGDWLGMDDAHIMEGMLTRDLIRQCNGVPKF